MRTVLFIFWAIPCFVFAKEQSSVAPKQFELHLGIDKDGGFIPSFRLPLYWSEKRSSVVRFSQSMNTENVPMIGFAGSKTVQATVREIGVTLLSFHLGNSKAYCAIGGGVHYKRMSRYEFGFFYYPFPVDKNVTFENESDIRLISPAVEGDLWLVWPKVKMNIHTLIKPVNLVFYEQEILFNPLLPTKSSDDYSVQGPILTLTVAPYITIKDYCWIGLWGHGHLMKISYERKLLNYDGEFHFSDDSLSFSEVTLYAEGRIGFPRFSLLGTTPFMGGGVKYVREEMGRDSESGTIPYFTFGLEVF